jgi:hypothetical protein
MKTHPVYNSTISELQGMIITQYGSIKKFSIDKNFEYKHLCKIINGSKVMSLIYFLRLCIALNLTNESVAYRSRQVNGNITLIDFFSIPFTDIQQALFKINLDH